MRYLGCKDNILPAIHALLVSKGLIGRPYRFFDAFCGTGAVANSLKDYFNIIINDSMQWSVTYSLGRITGRSCSFEGLGFDPFVYFEKNWETRKGFFYTNYSPGGSDRMYFSAENAGRIDYIRSTIELWKNDHKISEKEYAYLIYSLIEGVSSVSNTAGVYGAFLKHWDSRSANKLQFRPIAETLFDKLDTKVEVETHCSRIEEIISDIECDILYLDPPYTQNQYGTQYHLLETLVLNDDPSISKITGSRPVTPMKSLWSVDLHAHSLFDLVIAKTKAKYILFSYNNDGFMSKEYIEATLKRYGKEDTYSCIEIGYKKYNNFKCRGKDGHFEYLFFIEKKTVKDVIYESPLNYSGSKAKLVPTIKKLLPVTIETFVDVFGGGFNVGINISAKNIIYNDINPYIVDLMRAFKLNDSIEFVKSINKLIKEYNLSPNNKDGYIRLRDKYNSMPKTERSPVMLYALILFGFQQQIRFNSNHDFNVPSGSRRFNDRLVSKYMSFSRIIQEKNISFINESFTNLSSLVNPGTFFYFDPPYRETRATYNDGRRGFEGWTINHEIQLCNFMDLIASSGALFMFSYVLQVGDFYNHEIEQWAINNEYRIIHVEPTQGRYNNRNEVLILNY